jgi:hypothetical protein
MARLRWSWMKPASGRNLAVNPHIQKCTSGSSAAGSEYAGEAADASSGKVTADRPEESSSGS